MTDRLDRTAQRTQANTATIEANRSAIALLNSTVNSLVDREATQSNFKGIVAELREIRTESQGILELLFGRQENET
ncbi:hypothetical protein [Calothrix sp. NIES-2098]|uniref:hypothetical protein n=1 Tax=Calothrix sp. NIES-2098 TaxID=1954171 RepID=UPI000B5EB673|nr:hypothetical protein NIES2098_18400 [Calothrix sp. NIES-2098]